jgi:ribonuclease P protein component
MRYRPHQHLRRPGEIRAVREQGRRIDCRAFTVWWRRRPPAAPEMAPARVCVIASTAAVGGAIHRNRAKRRLREVFRHQQTEVPSGCDLLLIARAAVNRWNMLELQNKFAEACRQIASSSKS